MAWTGSILNGVGGFTKIAANGGGDLQRALRRSVTSHIQLVGDVDADGNDVNKVNKMAKYKPFRDSAAAYASFTARNNARAAARYGMSEPVEFSPNSKVLPPAWTYLKPRAGQEPLRAEDFIKDDTTVNAGYDPAATSPLHLNMTQLFLNDLNGFYVWKDGGVNNDNSHSGFWWAQDRSMTVSELLTSRLNLYNSMHIALAVYVYNLAGTAIEATTVISFAETFNEISDSNPGWFRFSANGGVADDGIDYPAIPLLRDNPSYEGRKVVVAVCLCNTGPTGTAPYVVITSAQSCFSLAFDADSLTDRVELTAQLPGSLTKITGTLLSDILRLSKVGTEGDYDIYELQNRPVRGQIKTDSVYQALAFDIFTIITSPYGTIGASPYASGATGSKTFILNSVAPASAGGTYYYNLITLNDVLGNIYIYKDAPKQVTVTAYMRFSNGAYGTESKNFNNILTITD